MFFQIFSYQVIVNLSFKPLSSNIFDRSANTKPMMQ